MFRKSVLLPLMGLLLSLLLAACGTQSEQPELAPQAIFGGYNVNVVATQRWNGGFQGAVVLKNTNGAAARSFEIKFKLNGNNPITSSWGGTFSAPNSSGVITLTSPDYLKSNGVAKGESFSSGFVANNAFTGGTVSSLKVNGQVVGGGAGPVGPTTPTNPTNPNPPASVGGSWTAKNGRVYLNGKAVWINGLNWFGFDAADHKLHGLWTGRPLGDFLDQLKGYGFNALRVPLCPASINSGTPINDAAYTQYGKDAQTQVKTLLREMGKRNLYALLDVHTFDCGNHLTGTMLDGAYGKAAWLKDIRTLATLSKGFPNVLGIDVYNEPSKLTWNQFSDLAGEVGSAALAINKNILIFVEGVGGASPSGQWGANWGGNLFEASKKLPNLPKDKLVFSPHAYGPSVAAQDYFKTSSFPANLPKVWDSHFGYLQGLGYTVIPGEFGGRYTGDDKVWQDAFVNYVGNKKFGGFFYWALNPNSGDTGGLLLDDWKTVDQGKLNLLKNIIR